MASAVKSPENPIAEGTRQIEKIPKKPMSAQTSYLLALPISILRTVLRFLLVSPIPLALSHFSAISGRRKSICPAVLATCRVIYSAGLPILYGENTITTSSPSTSYEFDTQLAALSGKQRQCIRYIRLEIDWGDHLWAKFPLVARCLGEIRGLKGLEVVILERTENGTDEGTMIEGPKVERLKREGVAAKAMLKAEKKTLKGLVEGLRALQKFRLAGFRDKAFARKLEEWVKCG